MYAEEDFLQISGIQHFAFCRRQWALIHVEQQWVENVLTAKGRAEHTRVHDDKVKDYRNGKITIRGLKVHSYELGVSGECDAVEFSPVSDGITLKGREGQWSVIPIEYKHGTTKSNDCDRLQVAVQAMCLEEMFSYKIEKSYIFYFENRRREEVPLTDGIRKDVKETLEEMHAYMARKYTPKVKSGKGCNNCSLKNICIPKLQNKKISVAEYIEDYTKGKNHEEDA